MDNSPYFSIQSMPLFSRYLALGQLFSLSVALVFLSFSSSALAHPHSWISTKTTVNVEGGYIQSLSMDWLFDPMTTAYTLSGSKLTPKNRQQVFQKLSKDIQENLLYKHYFTYFYQGDNPIRYQAVEGAKISMVGPKLRLQFQLQLAKPIDLHTPKLSLYIFDPTYYIDMSWDDYGTIGFNGDVGSCRLHTHAPNPTSEQVAYAMSLQIDSDPDNELGKLFTQKATIDCSGE
ncbi:DUF1007 family protein [Vibrio superstes]|uniref:DUF1007 family protein n=1 Tax=Vibrio superstes TaxID=198815 RepID=UPI0013C31540|nr:DUF1007 family protein [Vibrio superstes]